MVQLCPRFSLALFLFNIFNKRDIPINKFSGNYLGLQVSILIGDF
jgi:hypothetical protein